jgi:hypothetical protein
MPDSRKARQQGVSNPARRWGWLAGLAALSLVAGFLIGTWRSGTNIATGRADSAGNGGGSIITHGWTYGFSSDVPWTDASNSWHEGGTPDCLPPLSSVDGVRFAWTEVSVEGVSWRHVVWIDCRSVSP